MPPTRLPDLPAARRRLSDLVDGATRTGAGAVGAGAVGAPGGWLADRRAVQAVLRSDVAAGEDVCAALTVLTELRTDLDRVEQRLIDAAREQKASWREIAGALGLRSRQAAEQRWLRLRSAAARDPAAVRDGRRHLGAADAAAGPEVAALRTAVELLLDRLSRLPELPRLPEPSGAPARTGVPEPAAAVPVRVGMARQTLAAAVWAPPGALLDLAALAVRDLSGVPDAYLGPPVVEALRRVAGGLDAAVPGSGED